MHRVASTPKHHRRRSDAPHLDTRARHQSFVNQLVGSAGRTRLREGGAPLARTLQ